MASTATTKRANLYEWFKTITFYEILVGMKATLSHLLHYRPVTLQYPHEKRTLPDNYRGMLCAAPIRRWNREVRGMRSL